jgi:hypothetical protein
MTERDLLQRIQRAEAEGNDTQARELKTALARLRNGGPSRNLQPEYQIDAPTIPMFGARRT